MRAVPKQHIETLRVLRTIWDADRFLVIGAVAVETHTGLKWRGTSDLDLAVASALDDYSRHLESLGWRRERGAYQRWIAQDGSKIDVMPSSPELVQQGEFTWPDGGQRMTLTGFRLAHEDAVVTEIAQGCAVRITSPRSLVVPKIAAYLDQPRERDNDLTDIAHIMFEYLPEDADERWSDEIVELRLDFEDTGPFVLGKQIGALVDDPERRLIETFIKMIEDRADRLSTLQRMAQGAPVRWRDPDQLRSRLTAFWRGIEASMRRV